MEHGGKRVGAGRPKGAKSAKTLEIARKAIESGLTPLEYMMEILRDVNQPKELRFEAAKSAAPYIHPHRFAPNFIKVLPKPGKAERDRRRIRRRSR